ncbi:MAG: LysR family transcriptional regulator [Thermoleophilia bacterium]
MNDLRPTVSVEQLHTFAAVARHGHITRAAAAIHVSQGSVSQQVQRLEAALGVALLERAGRGVRLTEAGRAVAAAAGTAVAAIRAVEATAASFRELGAGAVTIAASNTVGIHRAPVWIAGFLDRHPAIEVNLRLDNTAGALAALRAGEVDLALVEGDVRPGPIETLVLERDELVLAAGSGHPLAAARRVTSADLRRHRYLAREDGSGTEELARELVGPAYRGGPVLELGHLEAVRTGVAAGLGYAVLPRTVAAAEVVAGRAAILAHDRRSVWRAFRAVRRAGFAPPALDALWRHLRLAVAAPD